MRIGTDDLVELLAREHRTVEGLLDDLAEVERDTELYSLLQVYARMSKAELVAALTHH